MRIVRSIRELRQQLASLDALRPALSAQRRRSASIGFVPTMGALHAGHGRLIETSVRETDSTVVSIFVNPSQFNDPADFAKYPRSFDTDAALCESLGAGIVFAPPEQEMYPAPQLAFVDVAGVSEPLEGKFRAGHFRGVATIVMKLLQIVQPDRAYFGEKDAQQLAVIRRMAADLNVPVEIVGVATVREPDGLAMSSRNQRLTPAERALAPVLYQALQLAASRIAQGVRDPEAVKQEALASLAHPEIRVEYLEIVDPVFMQPVELPIDLSAGPVRIAVAARFGSTELGATRLIDNVLVA
jgi:pantoate--beta-alanine ligase